MSSLFGALATTIGRINVETPEYQVTSTHEEANFPFEIRQYSSSVAVQAPVDERAPDNVAFRSLAKYIGVFGNPENDQQAAASGNEQIAMTAPVVTGQEEPIAAVAGRQAEPIAMTAPVVTSADGQGENQNAIGYMQFLLPSKYTQIEDAPQPTNPKLHLVQVPCRLLAVHQYSGFTDYADAQAKANSIAKVILEHGAFDIFSTRGETLTQSSIDDLDSGKLQVRFQLARYNPPWTLPFFRTNEVWISVVPHKETLLASS